MSRKTSRGFTLIELMIAVVIVAILAAIALPSYRDQVRKTSRSAAKSALLDASSRMETFYLDNRTYTTALSSLGYDENTRYIDKNGYEVDATDSSRIYSITAAACSGGIIDNCYTLTATPLLDQANDSCSTLTLDSNGAKTPTTSGCW